MRLFALTLYCFLTFSNSYAEENIQESAQLQPIESVTVLASSSLTMPISLISKKYSREHAVDVNAVFESAPELLRKIEEGDPADIVITANKLQMDDMQSRGVVDPSSRVILAGNRISLVSSQLFEIEKENKKLEELLDFSHSRALMIIADPKFVSLGEFSIEMLEKTKKWNKFKNFVVLAPTSSKTADLIVKSQTAGVVYTTDAIIYSKELNHLGMIPDSLHSPIEYHAALVVGNNMTDAKKYLTYLSSNISKNILRDNGFVVE